ncbi:DUF1289 domain-containing protein [Polycladidibacter stylochi]|uniref:DUF1289 domain-containing protein n=1 Tax=Polycladidibacter stylochi TaxID=1807766 RepID=UPI000AE7F9C9|nr:DUF1289 domain-containing protein [Pseudovibrio stylochi]
MVSKQQIVSPCNGICTIDPLLQICRGCYRNLEEISQWREMSMGEKEALQKQLVLREKKYFKDFGEI